MEIIEAGCLTEKAEKRLKELLEKYYDEKTNSWDKLNKSKDVSSKELTELYIFSDNFNEYILQNYSCALDKNDLFDVIITKFNTSGKLINEIAGYYLSIEESYSLNSDPSYFHYLESMIIPVIEHPNVLPETLDSCIYHSDVPMVAESLINNKKTSIESLSKIKENLKQVIKEINSQNEEHEEYVTDLINQIDKILLKTNEPKTLKAKEHNPYNKK